MIGKELLGYFDYSLNAIFTAEENKISYLNPAARKLFPGIRTGDSAEVLGAGITASDRPGVFATIICDKPCNVTASVFDDTAVYTVYPIDDEIHGNDTELMSAVCRSMAESVSVIKMSGDLILPYVASSESEKAEKYAATINKSALKLSRLVSNLGRIYGFDRGVRSEKLFDIAQLCSDITGTVSELVSDMGFEIAFVGVKEGMNFYGDRKDIEKLLLNLLSNSIKYSKPGSKISVSMSTNGKKVTLSVSDSGSGISADVLTDVFHRFDAEKKPTDADAGPGMGLWIVKSIAQEHGGTVLISSREDVGTTVSVSLPVRESGETVMHTPKAELKADGMRTILTELSDVLGYEKYTSRYLD